MEPSQPENLWLKLLNQSSKRVLVPESACVVAGEADSGKAALLSRLAQQPSLQVAASSLELIHYNFIDVEDSSLAMPTKVHLWQLDERLLPCAKDLLSSTMSQVRSSLPHHSTPLVLPSSLNGMQAPHSNSLLISAPLAQNSFPIAAYVHYRAGPDHWRPSR